MPTFLQSLISRTVTPKSETVLEFSKRSLDDYSSMLLETAGITDLKGLNLVFTRDPGLEVEVVERRFGRGVDFKDPSFMTDERYKGGWMLFERTPLAEGEGVRARLFNSFEGAAAEFSIKLRLQREGDVALCEVASRPGAVQLSFQGGGRTMIMAPVEAAHASVTKTFTS
jgi:hypothetical protein